MLNSSQRNRILGMIMWRIKNKAGSTAETCDLYGSVCPSWTGMNRTVEGTVQTNKGKKVWKSFCTSKWLNKPGLIILGMRRLSSGNIKHKWKRWTVTDSHSGWLSPTRSQRQPMKLTDGRFRTKGGASRVAWSRILHVPDVYRDSENKVKLSQME